MTPFRSPLALREFRRANPLTEELPLERTAAHLQAALVRAPWNPQELAQIPPDDRISMATDLFKQIVVTEDLLSIQLSMQRMVSDSLHARNPNGSFYASRIYQLAHLQQNEDSIDSVEWLPWNRDFEGGMNITGETGVGKSMATESLYTQWKQVIEHREGPLAYLKQLTWLKVHMPSDGHRGGFLLNAFEAVDQALESDYATKYFRLTIEKQLIKLLYVLAKHRCGVLIIEEAQEENLHVTPFGPEFFNFFLRLLNWSIPVVIIGNPLATKLLESRAQLMARFSAYGGYRLTPLPQDDPEWDGVWMESIWKPCMTTQPDEPIADVSARIWRSAGGFPRYLQRLRMESEIAAMRNSSERVTATHIAMAARGKSMNARRLTRAFATKDLRALSSFTDIDTAYYAALWNKPVASGSNIGASSEHVDSANNCKEVPEARRKSRKRSKPSSGPDHAQSPEADLTKIARAHASRKSGT